MLLQTDSYGKLPAAICKTGT